MAKKKKDPVKKAALQAKKAEKADKAARKRLTKVTKGEGGDENENSSLDDLLESYRQKDSVAVENTVLKTLPGFPPPRANATLTLADDKNGHVFLFGGEYYDGVTNIVLNDLFRWDVTKNEWRQVLTPPASPKPGPRCAHSTVYYKDSLYVLGGELASAEEYHHYRDLWRFDLVSLKWHELSTTRGTTTTTAPSARSGHAAFVWKHYMVVFGGFYEALRDTIWYNDVHVLDFQTLTWMDIPHSKLASRPEPRSACNVGLRENVAIIHGGYSKLKNPGVAEQKVHSDAWLLHLKPILQGQPPTWERLSNRKSKGCSSSSSSNPSNRSGTASVTYKDRMLVYGGVVDTEQHHHRVDSVFYNDLFTFDMERKTWFPLRCKAVRETKSRRRRKKDNHDNDDDEEEEDYDEEEEVKGEEEEETEDESSELEEEEEDGENPASSGWDLDKLRSNMFAFIDGDGNIVYEKILEETDKDGYEADAGEAAEAEANDIHVDEAKENDTDEDEEEEAKGDDSDDEEEGEEDEEKVMTTVEKNVAVDKNTGHLQSSACHVVASSSVMKVNQETGAPEPVAREEPLPRINATVIVRSNILYVYGGILEVGDREVTLDDCWCFDLRKRDKWECLWGGTMHKQVWRGAIHDDDDSYISTDVGGDDEDDDDDEDVGDKVKDEDVLGAVKAAKKMAKREQEKSKRAGLRQHVSELKGKLDLDSDVNRTPQMGEALAEFYSRTNQYWNDQAAANIAARSSDAEKLSSKELKRQGFKLASERYDELRPVLERLDELELQRTEAEEDKKNRKEKRKVKK